MKPPTEKELILGVATHGHSGSRRKKRSPTYSSWQSMKSRCLNPKSTGYRQYGARGITVCDRWIMSFESFLVDMGERPKGTSLDRYPDRNGNYEPGNCRWATPEEQARNKCSNRRLTFQGQTLTLIEWANLLGSTYKTLHTRLSDGWPVERVLAVPTDGLRTGGLSHAAKLTQAQVDLIRMEYVRGSLKYGAPALGRRYAVTPDAIESIIKGRTWKESLNRS